MQSYQFNTQLIPALLILDQQPSVDSFGLLENLDTDYESLNLMNMFEDDEYDLMELAGEVAGTLNVAQAKGDKKAIELWQLINKARANPKSVIPLFEARIAHESKWPGNEKRIAATRVAIQFLKN